MTEHPIEVYAELVIEPPIQAHSVDAYASIPIVVASRRTLHEQLFVFTTVLPNK